MGRRAKKAPVQTKKRATLAKRFKCPFCANEETVECKMDFRAGIGSLSCRLCSASYQMPIHHLHEPVDVFSEWLDDCEAAAQGKPTNSGADSGMMGGGGPGGVPRYESESDEEQALPERSGLGKSSEPKAKSNEKSEDGGRPTYEDLGLGDSDDDED